MQREYVDSSVLAGRVLQNDIGASLRLSMHCLCILLVNTAMALHLDTNDPKYAAAAADILRRHNAGDAKATGAAQQLEWLRASAEGKAVEAAVGRLLGGG